MTYFQSKSLNTSALSQSCWRSAFLLVLVGLLTLATSCTNEDKPVESISEPMLKGIISYYNDYDGAMLDITKARAVSAGNIASRVLHRCSTPFTNTSCRACYVSDYLEYKKVMTVLNLADTEEKMQAYDMPPYSRTLWEGGNVILCPLKADPTADDYNNRLIAALKELTSRPAPYVVHCMEGKDRTGYVCALRSLTICSPTA